MLGTDLCLVFAARGYDIVAADVADLDLTDPAATTQPVRGCRPSVITNCADYTAVVQSESDAETAFGVNRDGVEGKSLRVVNDHRGCPTCTVHLAETLATIVAQPHYGIYHAVNASACTWYDLARVAVQEAGLHVEVTPVATAGFTRPAPRPANSVLDTPKLAAVRGVRLPPWREGISAFVQQWRHQPPGGPRPPAANRPLGSALSRQGCSPRCIVGVR